MKLADLAHATACCVLPGIAQLTGNWHAACTLACHLGRAVLLCVCLAQYHGSDAKSWLVPQRNACVRVGDVDDDKD